MIEGLFCRVVNSNQIKSNLAKYFINPARGIRCALRFWLAVWCGSGTKSLKSTDLVSKQSATVNYEENRLREKKRPEGGS